jgi:two-component system chemotaxis response regulator CheY
MFVGDDLVALILVVDDSAYARRLMRRNLEAAQHEVIEADGGMAAIEAYFLRRPEVVLLDLTMEDVSGLDVLRKIKELDTNARVVVVSADVQSSTEDLVRAAGALAFLGKPVASPELLKQIDAALGKSHVE